jgi:hypothetical protein
MPGTDWEIVLPDPNWLWHWIGPCRVRPSPCPSQEVQQLQAVADSQQQRVLLSGFVRRASDFSRMVLLEAVDKTAAYPTEYKPCRIAIFKETQTLIVRKLKVGGDLVGRQNLAHHLCSSSICTLDLAPKRLSPKHTRPCGG